MMFNDVELGARVWSVIFGWGTVTNKGDSRVYNVEVEFDNGRVVYHAADGTFDHNQLQTLFWGEIKFEIPDKPLPKLEVDAKLIVWNDEHLKYSAHFSHYHNGHVVAFSAGRTKFTASGNVTHWSNWEVVD